MKTEYSSKLAQELSKIASKSVPVAVDVVNIQIAADATLDDFCRAFVKEGYRKNPLMAERVNLTEEELRSYCQFLIQKRVEIVNGKCREWQLIKRFAMPCFIEMVLTSIGIVKVREKGIELVPTCEMSDLKAEDFMETSGKVEAFVNDLAVVCGAMPADLEGDVDLMSMAVIDGYVRGMEKVDSPVAEYVAWFLQLTLEEKLFTNLYRVQYDDVRTIESMIASLGKVIVG